MNSIDSPGAISGIVIGCLVVLALTDSLCLFFFCYYCKRRSSFASNAIDLEAGLTEGGPSILPISSHATSDRHEWTDSSARVDSQDNIKKKKRSKGFRVKGKSKGFFGFGLGAKEDDLKPSQHYAAEEDVEMHQISTVKGSGQVAPPSGMMIGGQESRDLDERTSSQATESKAKTR